MRAPLVPLGNVAAFVRGVTYKPVDLVENFSAGSLVCMRTANIQTQLDQTDLKSIPAPIVKSADKRLLAGDILVSTANSWNLVGKCCWVPALEYDAVPGGFIAALRADREQVEPRYLYHWFNSPRTQDLARNCGRQTTNISNMDLNRCLAIQIPLPPLPEQRRIAAILDQADALRAKRRQAIAKLDQLLQSVFLEMFGDPVVNPKGWPEVALDELVASTKLGVIRSASEFGFDPKFGVPYVRMDAISREGQFLPDRVQRTKAAPAELQENSLQYGDLLFNTRNSRELVGKSAIFNQQGEWIFNNNLMRIRFRPQASHHYIHSYLYSNRGHRELEARKSGTTSVFAVYHKDLKTLPIPLPPRSLQEKFAEICKSVDQSKGRLETEATQMNALMASLQHSFFPAAA